jgi:hypothetical protein
MAVKIPIVTVFDSKGLRAAQYQLNKISGNVSNLSRNFAIAGTALAGFGVFLGKSVQQASNLGESINAINVSFGRSAAGILKFGETASTTLGLSQVEFNNAAVRFSAFADRIVGAGGDTTKFIEDITTRAADFASVYNIDVADALARFQSGLAGQTEPLAQFGVNLLDSEVKAYAVRAEIAKVGEELSATQKVQARYGLLMEATNKTTGDFSNTSGSLANQLRIMKSQVADTQGEIGNALLPVLQEILPVVRDLVLEFGTKLKTAVQGVDWKSLITDVVNLLTFLVQNIEVITRLVVVMWTLNTAFNAIKIVVGLTNVVLTLFNFALGNTEVAAKKTTGVINGLKTALLLGGVTVAVGSVIDEYRRLQEVIKGSTTELSKFDTEVIAISGAAAKLNPINTLWQNITKSILGAVTAQRDFNSGAGKSNSYSIEAERRRDAAMAARGAGQTIPGLPSLESITTPTSGGSSSRPDTVAQVLKREGVLATREAKLLKTGVSEGLAGLIVGTATTKKSFQAELKKLTSSTNAVSKAQAKFNKTAAGKAEIASIKAQNEANEAIAESNRQAAIQAAAEQAARDAAILAEKQRVYESFASSISNLFSRIQESILSAFSLPELGGSTDSIIRNMDKLLARVKSFSQNITKLSSMGLDPKLLQQVINAGPIAGAKLAANLVSGGVGGLTAINKGYAELGGLAGEIGMTGTQAAFNNQAQQTIYNVNINGGLDSGASIGKAVVDAVRAYERTSGPVWQGA